jgi:hypothetical protein
MSGAIDPAAPGRCPALSGDATSEDFSDGCVALSRLATGASRAGAGASAISIGRTASDWNRCGAKAVGRPNTPAGDAMAGGTAGRSGAPMTLLSGRVDGASISSGRASIWRISDSAAKPGRTGERRNSGNRAPAGGGAIAVAREACASFQGDAGVIFQSGLFSDGRPAGRPANILGSRAEAWRSIELLKMFEGSVFPRDTVPSDNNGDAKAGGAQRVNRRQEPLRVAIRATAGYSSRD